MWVSENEPRSGLCACLHQKGQGSDGMLTSMADALYSMASAGDSEVTYERAQAVPTHTYIFHGAMIWQTDMRPVKKDKQP